MLKDGIVRGSYERHTEGPEIGRGRNQSYKWWQFHLQHETRRDRDKFIDFLCETNKWHFCNVHTTQKYIVLVYKCVELIYLARHESVWSLADLEGGVGGSPPPPPKF